MATTDYDFNQTRSEVIERAFRIIGVGTPGQSLSGEQTAQGVVALNVLVKQWQTRRVFLWTIKESSLAFTASTANATLGNEVLGIDKAWYTTSNSDIPIEIISYRKYQEIVNKTSESATPTYIAMDYSKTTPDLYLYPTPSANITIYFLAVERLQDMDSSGGNADIPQRFLQALTYGLADVLSDEYGLPLNERQYIKNKYDEYFFDAQKSDYEWEDETHVAGAYSSKC
jgi:hypothetical protein